LRVSDSADIHREKMGNKPMKKILHLSCSPRGQASESHRLAQKIIGFLLNSEPGTTLLSRVVSGDAIPHVDANYATVLGAALVPSAEISQEGSISYSEVLIRELESADYVVIGTPMHNFTVPSALKAWIDHIVRIRRTFNMTSEGKVGTLHDRPVYVAVSSGGNYSGEHAHQPDFLTPYLKAILATIGLRDLTFFSVEGAAFGPDALAAARNKADLALQEYFSSSLPSHSAAINR
jgi:FMN-dependent NADH-azoreductase